MSVHPSHRERAPDMGRRGPAETDAQPETPSREPRPKRQRPPKGRRVYVTQKIELDGIRYEVVPTGGTKATVYRRTKRDGPLRKVTDPKEWTHVLIALSRRHERGQRRRQAIDAVAREAES